MFKAIMGRGLDHFGLDAGKLMHQTKLVLSLQATAQGTRRAPGVDFLPIATVAVTATPTYFLLGALEKARRDRKGRARMGSW